MEQALWVTPLSIERMTLTHSGNTIYDVALPQGNVIVRLREGGEGTFARTVHNIQELAKLGLPVPRVLVSDTTYTRYPFAYILLEKIPGRDLLYELEDMTPAQRTRLAEQIVAFQRKVGTLPLGTGFGWGHINEGGPEPAWFDVFPSEEETVLPTAENTHTSEFKARLHQQRIRFQPYFQKVKPVCFLEDLTTKNVLLERGELQGIIDFDCVCFGDPIWMIGVAAGCIVADIGPQGLFYTEELCRCWELTEEKRQIVTYYSAQQALWFLTNTVSEPGDGREERLISTIEEWLGGLE